MHDFGEYLPFDSVLFDGSDPVEYHNRYPGDWAQVVREALDEIPGGDEIVYFMRAGSSTSPKDTGVFWMGDQTVIWDKYDGLHSALIGILNGGVSGFTMGHSDLGGYNAVDFPGIPGNPFRSQELMHRWIEMSSFSDAILRSHPSNRPNDVY